MVQTIDTYIAVDGADYCSNQTIILIHKILLVLVQTTIILLLMVQTTMLLVMVY